MLQTPLCRQLGIEYPLFSVGMGGGMAGPELVAAVSNAGACGILGMGGLRAPYIRQQIHQLRTLTTKPFGVNLLLPLLQEGQIEMCLDEQMPFIVLFWGTPRHMSRRPTAVARRSFSRWAPWRKRRPRPGRASMPSLPKGLKRVGM